MTFCIGKRDRFRIDKRGVRKNCAALYNQVSMRAFIAVCSPLIAGALLSRSLSKNRKVKRFFENYHHSKYSPLGFTSFTIQLPRLRIDCHSHLRIYFWAKYRECAFGSDAPRPFLGWIMLLEECDRSNTPMNDKEPHFPVDPVFKGASYTGIRPSLQTARTRRTLYQRDFPGITTLRSRRRYMPASERPYLAANLRHRVC